MSGEPAQGSSPAGFWKRYAAYFIDWLLLGLVSNMLMALPSMLYSRRLFDLLAAQHRLQPVEFLSRLSHELLIPLTLWSLAIWVLLAFPYFVLTERSSMRGSPGKLALGIVVADLEGRPIGLGRASLRFFATSLSWLTLNLGHALAAWRADKRALHDLIAGTTVLNRDPLHPQLPLWAKWMIGLQLGLLVVVTFGLALFLAIAWLTSQGQI